MNKLYSVLAATVVVVAGAASADAGFGVRLNIPAGFSQVEKAGCGGSHVRFVRRRFAHQSVRRPKRKVEVAVRKVEKPVTVAKIDPKPIVEEESLASVTENENSTVAVAADEIPAPAVIVPEKKPAKAAANAVSGDTPGQKVAAALKDIGCKSFFASVGMTLSVPCAK